MCVAEYQDVYILKICGEDQFLLSDYPVSQYKVSSIRKSMKLVFVCARGESSQKTRGSLFLSFQHIRQCVARSKIPQLMLMKKTSVFNSLPKNKFTLPSYVQRGSCNFLPRKYSCCPCVNVRALAVCVRALLCLFRAHSTCSISFMQHGMCRCLHCGVFTVTLSAGVSALANINSQNTMSLWHVDATLKITINFVTYVNVREVGKVRDSLRSNTRTGLCRFSIEA